MRFSVFLNARKIASKKALKKAKPAYPLKDKLSFDKSIPSRFRLLDVHQDDRLSECNETFFTGLTPELNEALLSMKISKPTEIQEYGMFSVLKERFVLLASHTGSGKTLAYLLPLFLRIKQNSQISTCKTSPKALIMAPTKELVTQVTVNILLKW